MPHGTRAQVFPGSRRAVDRPVVLVEKLEVRLRLGRKPVILQAQRIEQRIARLPAATLDLGSVAVNMGLLELAVIEIALHRPVVGNRIATVHRDQLRLVFCGLRPRVDRAVIVVEKLDRGGSDHAEIVVGDRSNEVDLGVRPFPAEIAVEAREPRRRLVAPAVILEAFGGEIEPPLALAHAVLQRAADAAVGAAGRIDFEAVISEAVLHLQVDGAAQCVEAEGGVVGPDVGAADGNRRDQVPVDGIAEGFVDADALHVDGEPLRGALQRGGGKAAIAQVLDEAVALNVRGDDAGDALRQGLDHAGGIHPREVIGGERLHHRRHLAAIKADAGHRRGRDNLQGGQRAGDGERRGGNRPRYRRSAGRRRWSPRRRGCRPRRDDGDLGQRRRGLAPRNFRKHWRAWQYQRAQCSGLPQPPFAGRKSRPIPITPTRPTHHNAPEFPRSTLGHSGSSVPLRFANRGWNIWQCGRGDTPGASIGMRCPPLCCSASCVDGDMGN